MHRMRTLTLLISGSLLWTACATAPVTTAQKDEQRASIRAMANQTLEQLYKQYPQAKAKVEGSAGYAVFSDFGMQFLLLGGAGGQGVAVDNATKKATYMKMAEIKPGYGLGAQNFRVVFLFASPADFKTFISSGWEFGADAMASAKTSTQGAGAEMGAAVGPGVTMYQLSEQGAIVGVSLTAAKYYRYDELN